LIIASLPALPALLLALVTPSTQFVIPICGFFGHVEAWFYSIYLAMLMILLFSCLSLAVESKRATLIGSKLLVYDYGIIVKAHILK
jgi:hypothetical protein